MSSGTLEKGLAIRRHVIKNYGGPKRKECNRIGAGLWDFYVSFTCNEIRDRWLRMPFFYVAHPSVIAPLTDYVCFPVQGSACPIRNDLPCHISTYEAFLAREQFIHPSAP
jgi:hypothetical protein